MVEGESPVTVEFALFPKLALYGPAEGGWYWVEGKDCEVGIPIVKCLISPPGVEFTRILGEFS